MRFPQPNPYLDDLDAERRTWRHTQSSGTYRRWNSDPAFCPGCAHFHQALCAGKSGKLNAMVAPFVKSLAEQIDTTGSGGKLIFHVFGALTEFEQDLIRREQMLAIRQLDEKKLQMLQPLYADKSNSVADILATLNISKSTLYRYVKQDKRL